MKIVMDAGMPALSKDDVEIERDRRVDAGFPFMGKMIQSRQGDRENIAGAKSAAMDAIVMGAQPGAYDWQRLLDPVNGAVTFAWITLDNSLLPLDAQSTIQLGYAALTHKQALIFKAKAIKDRIAGGETIANVRADDLWQ